MTRLPEPAFTEGSTGCVYCPGKAEPEQDGDVIFFACPKCGGEFGQRRAVQPVPVCAAGLPLAEAGPGGPAAPETTTFLGSTIPRRPQ